MNNKANNEEKIAYRVHLFIQKVSIVQQSSSDVDEIVYL